MDDSNQGIVSRPIFDNTPGIFKEPEKASYIAAILQSADRSSPRLADRVHDIRERASNVVHSIPSLARQPQQGILAIQEEGLERADELLAVLDRRFAVELQKVSAVAGGLVVGVD